MARNEPPEPPGLAFLCEAMTEAQAAVARLTALENRLRHEGYPSPALAARAARLTAHEVISRLAQEYRAASRRETP